VISSACSEQCIEKDFELYHLNRGNNRHHQIKNVKQIIADIRNKKQVQEALRGQRFEVVVNWIAYEPEDVMSDYEIFKDKTLQYIFISSASAYQKPPSRLPISESEPLINAVWKYSQNKIACEKYLTDQYKNHQFPVTIVRPSHTYDKTVIPLHGGYTTLNRMFKEKPVIIHGDGTSLWTLTHHQDFARGFVSLVGNPETIGEDYHITSDEILTWDQICEILAEEAGTEPRIVHIPSDVINKFDKNWGDGLLGDKAHCLIFDNSKIRSVNPDFKATISFKEGVREIIAWYLADKTRQVIDIEEDRRMDKMIAYYNTAFPDSD
jgi:nucleoside-diphosphate-sugar epimerase